MSYCTERQRTPAAISTVFRAQRESQCGGNAKQGWARHLHHHHHHWWGWEGCMRGCHSGAVCSSYVITCFEFFFFFFGHIFLVRVGSRDQMGDRPHSRRRPPRSSARIAASPWQQVPSKATDSDTSESAVGAVVETLARRRTTTGRGVNRRANAKCSDTHSIRFHSVHATVTRGEEQAMRRLNCWKRR